jgi:hypothetical protein
MELMTSTETVSDHANIYAALAAAQAMFATVKKGSVNPAFKSPERPKGTLYADLADVVAAVAPALSANGIAYYHYIPVENERVMVTALVHAKSESRVECAVPLLVSTQNMHGFKSATTYAKRIGLESVTGVAPEEDDDGNAAAKNPAIVDNRLLSAAQFTELRDLMERSGSDEGRFLAFFKLEALEEMPVAKFDAAKAMLVKKIGSSVDA